MDNIVLNREFEIEVVRRFEVGQLNTFLNILNNAISDLRLLKETAVLCNKDTQAVEYQRYLHNAEYNKKLMEQVLTEKEQNVTMAEATIVNVFLN
jgi:hypothetical protein